MYIKKEAGKAKNVVSIYSTATDLPFSSFRSFVKCMETIDFCLIKSFPCISQGQTLSTDCAVRHVR